MFFKRRKPDADADIQTSARIISDLTNGLRPRVAVILGSGLGAVAGHVSGAVEIPYGVLPGFPQTGVQGHDGRLIAGSLDGVPVVFLCGRKHLYEGDDMSALKSMIRTMKAIGVETLVVTAAAGSLRPDLPPGSLMAVYDHINMTGGNPLQGPNDDQWGPRFPPMNDAWNPELSQRMMAAGHAVGVPVGLGVYVSVLGPNFETPAEIRFYQTIGADCIGMSVVPDCIIARHCGLNVVGCIVITNMAAGLSETAPSHAETLEWAAATGEGRLSHLLARFLRDVYGYD